MANPSVSHPILVDPAPSRAPGDPGRVGMTTAPGKKAKSGAGTWARDLGMDLARLRVDYKTDVLVCLLEPHELVGLGIPELAGAALEAGILTLLADPVCANVEEVGHLTARDYRLLRRQTLPWRVVEIEWSWPVDIDDAPRFPNLREVRVDTTSALLGTRMPFWNTVERLVIGKTWEDVLDVVSWMPSLRSVRYWTGGARAEWRRAPGRPWKRV